MLGENLMRKWQKYSLIISCILLVIIISFVLARQWNIRRVIASFEIAEPLRTLPEFENVEMFAYLDDVIVIAHITNNSGFVLSEWYSSLEFFFEDEWRVIPPRRDIFTLGITRTLFRGSMPSGINLDHLHPFRVSGLYRFRSNVRIIIYDGNYILQFSEAEGDFILIPAPPHLSQGNTHHDLVAEFYMCFRPRIFCSCPYK